MTGSAGVMALVLAETVAGSAAFLWYTPLWREVKRGYFTLTGVILTIVAFAAWRAAAAGAIAGDDAGTWSVRLTLASLIVTAVWTALQLLKQNPAARGVGFLSVPVAIAVLVAMSTTGRQNQVLAVFELLAGAAFLGAVLDGLLLGHWYLTDRGLSRTPIERATRIMLAAVVVEAIAVISGGFSGVGSSEAFNPLLTAGALAPWIALGMVGTTALIAVMVKATLRGTRASAVQSATGFFYLAVVTAFTAEVAVKVRFLPG
ncbi:MAG: hypothetical protein ABI595_09415 [Actinomycetota bacterium]